MSAEAPDQDAAPDQRGSLWWWAGAAAVMIGFLGGGGAYAAQARVEDPEPVIARFAPLTSLAVAGTLRLDAPDDRSLDVYRGHGAWVDVFDYDPAYAGPAPDIGAADLADMAEHGVDTVYLQAARLDERTPGGLVDPWRLTELLLSAHARGLAVVGWYLPRFGAGTDDLDRLRAIHGFEVLGERFDGLAVDIEWTGDDVDDDTRSARLVELGAALRATVGDDPVAAITLPPVLIEVVNPEFWPGFPWSEIAADYDVWMPMSYWSFRSDESGYGDGYTYHEESVRRLRANIGDPEALVHGIGGIGGVDGIDDPVDPEEPLATVEEIGRFLVALDDTGSIGGSIYDWNTMEPAARELLRDHFAVAAPPGE